MAILEVKNITKSFGKIEVLKGVSFSLEQGQVMSILGSSGSGKTTLLRCINFLEDANGGQIFVDSSLIERKVQRTDAEAYYIPATKLASDNDLSGLANMIMIGYMIKKSGIIPYENIAKTVEKIVPAKKQHLVEANKKAIELGYNYIEA